MCSFSKIPEEKMFEGYQNLKKQPFINQFALIINGDFSLNQERTALDNASEKLLKEESFLVRIKEKLDEAQKDSSGYATTFGKLLARVNNEAIDELREIHRRYGVLGTTDCHCCISCFASFTAKADDFSHLPIPMDLYPHNPLLV